MEVPRGNLFAYRNWHTLKKEYQEEMALDLFDICFDLDRTKDFPFKGPMSTDTFLLKERAPIISDDYLIDLCNECLDYDNVLALNILIAEIAKRNLTREPGNRILVYKEMNSNEEDAFTPSCQKHSLSEKIIIREKKNETLKNIIENIQKALTQLDDILIDSIAY